MSQPPLVASVLHPSDFSDGSENAFHHALAVAIRTRSELAIAHAGPARASDWARFPRVRETLEQWGLLEEGSPSEAVFDELSIRVKKTQLPEGSTVTAILDYIDTHAPHLIVLATEGREGLPRWLHPSTAERLARRSKTMTLFVPEKARGFVAAETGAMSVERILVPVDRRPRPDAAVDTAHRAAQTFSDREVEVDFLHVGEPSGMPALDLPESEHCRFRKLSRGGEVVETIARVAGDEGADLIVMATEGQHGILDALRGSVTERTVRQAPCPVLAVPVG